VAVGGAAGCDLLRQRQLAEAEDRRQHVAVVVGDAADEGRRVFQLLPPGESVEPLDLARVVAGGAGGGGGGQRERGRLRLVPAPAPALQPHQRVGTVRPPRGARQERAAVGVRQGQRAAGGAEVRAQRRVRVPGPRGRRGQRGAAGEGWAAGEGGEGGPVSGEGRGEVGQ